MSSEVLMVTQLCIAQRLQVARLGKVLVMLVVLGRAGEWWTQENLQILYVEIDQLYMLLLYQLYSYTHVNMFIYIYVCVCVRRYTIWQRNLAIDNQYFYNR